MDFVYYSLLLLFVVVALFMILLVLIQKGRGGGLSSAFGGVGGNTAFGTKTGDVLTWATSIVFGIFIVLAMVLGYLADRINTREHPLDNRGATALTKPADPSAGTLPIAATPTTVPAEPTTKP